MASLLPPPPIRSTPQGRDSVYVAALPLRATKGPPQMLLSAAYSLNFWELQHYMVIIKPSSIQPPQAFVFDFQPQDPENLYVALAALIRKPVPGVVLRRTLANLPKIRYWFVGFSDEDGVDMANKFSECWQTDLIVGEHDCRHYTNGLVEYLTGKRHVLELLRDSPDR